MPDDMCHWWEWDEAYGGWVQLPVRLAACRVGHCARVLGWKTLHGMASCHDVHEIRLASVEDLVGLGYRVELMTAA